MELPGEEDDLFVVTTWKVEEGMKIIVAKWGCTLPNGTPVEKREIGGFESEGVFVGPQELKWPSGTSASQFRPDQPIILSHPDADVGEVPSYEECVSLKNAPKEGGGGKKKGKKGKNAGGDDDDFDTMLAEFGVVKAKAGALGGTSNAKGKAGAATAAAAAEKAAEKEELTKDESAATSATADADLLNFDTTGMTAKQIANKKKKLKERMKAKAEKEEAKGNED